MLDRIAIGWAGVVVGFVMALWWLGRRVRERVIDIPRLVDVPNPIATCVTCGEELRPGPPTQLYLELYDCHGRQRAKWPVGKGERALQAAQADDPVAVARVNRAVWAQVVRCNQVDQGEADRQQSTQVPGGGA